MFENRIPFYKFLIKYRKNGYNVIQLQKAINENNIKLPFNLTPKEASIIINDFITNNKMNIKLEGQLQLFTLI